AMDELRARGLVDYVASWIAAERPLLGICLGFQLLFEASEEHQGATGFGFFDGTVRRLDAPGQKIPQIGWNDVRADGALRFADGHYYYFVHSFAAPATVPGADVATAEYGQSFAAAACRGQVWGAQFHPERSGRRGLEFLQTFLEQAR
ncbi:MAG: imidazole glycerol phosphate synthase subunit HisH, partial [Candidatus Dadabacteria bacterium]